MVVVVVDGDVDGDGGDGGDGCVLSHVNVNAFESAVAVVVAVAVDIDIVIVVDNILDTLHFHPILDNQQWPLVCVDNVVDVVVGDMIVVSALFFHSDAFDDDIDVVDDDDILHIHILALPSLSLADNALAAGDTALVPADSVDCPPFHFLLGIQTAAAVAVALVVVAAADGTTVVAVVVVVAVALLGMRIAVVDNNIPVGVVGIVSDCC